MSDAAAHNALIGILRRNLNHALRANQLETAEALLLQLQTADPISVTSRGFELEILVSRRRWEDAATLARQLLGLFPASARIHYLAGRVYFHGKQYRQALEHFSEADRLHPHWSAQRWRAKSHIERGEYDAAEALLSSMLVEHPIIGRDMAWLNERRGQPERALRDLDDYLLRRPQDEFAQAQRRRLRASTTAPDDLVTEIEELEALGEETPPEMIPSYIQGLLETGRGGEARHFVETHLQQWAPPLAAQVAWVCHRRQAFDLALRLFLAALIANKDNYKYLAALESSARRCQRLNEVCQAYRSLAANSPHLYGRLKALQRGTN